MRWSDLTHGERRKNGKTGLNLGKNPTEAIWGYLWGYFWHLA